MLTTMTLRDTSREKRSKDDAMESSHMDWEQPKIPRFYWLQESGRRLQLENSFPTPIGSDSTVSMRHAGTT